jgi:hypothetical protein
LKVEESGKDKRLRGGAEFAEERRGRETQDPGKKPNLGHPAEKREEHKGHREEKPKSTVRSDCATGGEDGR